MQPDPLSLAFARATSSDLAEIERLVKVAYSKYIERIGRKPAPMTDDYSELVKKGQTVVARLGERVVGVIVTEALPDHLHVSTIAVDPAAQGTGVGKALLERAEDQARGLGLTELRLYTNAKMYENLSYYPRRGYVEVGRRVEDGFDRVYFSRKL